MRPCRAQRLDQPPGVTCTTIRRPHRAQYRGGSSSLAARQAPWTSPAAGRPHRSQYPVSLTAGLPGLAEAGEELVPVHHNPLQRPRARDEILIVR
jgi:hypothetical protein